MERTSIKLAFLLLIVANASVLVPVSADAKCKDPKHKHRHHHHHHHGHRHPHPPTHFPTPPPVSLPPAPAPTPVEIPPYQIHGCGFKCADSNDCDWPCTVCCANQTCCYEEPISLPPSLPPSLSVEAPTPAPIFVDAPAADPPVFPPYQIHGCGYTCTDSNDCDWPCTNCCANNTCCYDEPVSLPPSLPPSLVVEAPAPAPIFVDAPEADPPVFPPYQIHGCGYTCTDSNDCDWPCTNCCANNTCCYDETMSLSPSPSPSSPQPPPTVIQAPEPIAVDTPPAFPTTFPPYQIHGCGYKCSDSNDCDWPCTMCCYQNQTCCYEEPFPE